MKGNQEKYAWDQAIEKYELEMQRSLSWLISGAIDLEGYRMEVYYPRRFELARKALQKTGTRKEGQAVTLGEPDFTQGFYEFSEGEK